MTRAELRAAGEDLERVVEGYVARFGEHPHTWGFPPESWRKLAALFREAVARGRPMGYLELYRRFGVEIPPDADL